mmetsp:Transcript_24194/g.78841  ORF Transcript_24194/g.78841 Transcript_24194/m.78841 type:complete len:92 (+) Transcript_24194:319-594(+)
MASSWLVLLNRCSITHKSKSWCWIQQRMPSKVEEDVKPQRLIVYMVDKGQERYQGERSKDPIKLDISELSLARRLRYSEINSSSVFFPSTH